MEINKVVSMLKSPDTELNELAYIAINAKIDFKDWKYLIELKRLLDMKYKVLTQIIFQKNSIHFSTNRLKKHSKY